MANKLKLITAKAKKLYATGKFKKWTDAIKEASKSLGAVKIIQKGEKKNAKVTKTLMQKRNKKGQFKGYSVVSGVKKKNAKKKAVKSYHKDTKSHNVRISVMSGVDEKFTRINNDINGNPRYVIHFLELINDEERNFIPFHKKYEYAIKKSKKLGGKKYDNKSYGGGIVFQSYNINDLWNKLQTLKHSTPKIKI